MPPADLLAFLFKPLYQVAPALDMLYLFMMAFCVYPLALAIRATNVYEERALGIQHDNEPSFKSGLYNLRREKGYSKFHLREQLAVSLRTSPIWGSSFGTVA